MVYFINMKVLLIQPDNTSTIGLSNISLMEPTGLEAVAGGLLVDRHKVRIGALGAADCCPDAYLRNAIDQFKPAVVGFSFSFTTDAYRTLDFA